MQIRMKRTAIVIGVLALLIAISGCAANKVAGHWRDVGVVADGYDREWSGIPQYYDGDRQFVIRVANNAATLSMCVASSQPDMTRQLRMGGLTVWFDPQGGKKKIFGIHLPGGHYDRLAGGQGPGKPGARPRHGKAPPMGGTPEGEPPQFEPSTELDVTYADTTGPLTMTISELRRSGIDIGVRQAGDGRLVYEFDIAFEAAPSLHDLKPGMEVGIGILIEGSAPGGPAGMPPGGPTGPAGFDSGNGGPGSSGGMGGGPGPGGRRQKAKAFEVWLQVRLAEPGAGQ